ncbi:MAG TPA: hypothetical protein VJ892_02165 [Candidatus Absconditabacterales bacterium]|nr:hypothetical protein [Candidatus Absconditabacterales bacterium]
MINFESKNKENTTNNPKIKSYINEKLDQELSENYDISNFGGVFYFSSKKDYYKAFKKVWDSLITDQKKIFEGIDLNYFLEKNDIFSFKDNNKYSDFLAIEEDQTKKQTASEIKSQLENIIKGNLLTFISYNDFNELNCYNAIKHYYKYNIDVSDGIIGVIGHDFDSNNQILEVINNVIYKYGDTELISYILQNINDGLFLHAVLDTAHGEKIQFYPDSYLQPNTIFQLSNECLANMIWNKLNNWDVKYLLQVIDYGLKYYCGKLNITIFNLLESEYGEHSTEQYMIDGSILTISVDEDNFYEINTNSENVKTYKGVVLKPIQHNGLYKNILDPNDIYEQKILQYICRLSKLKDKINNSENNKETRKEYDSLYSKLKKILGAF